jgi:hypothetical protein
MVFTKVDCEGSMYRMPTMHQTELRVTREWH